MVYIHHYLIIHSENHRCVSPSVWVARSLASATRHRFKWRGLIQGAPDVSLFISFYLALSSWVSELTVMRGEKLVGATTTPSK